MLCRFFGKINIFTFGQFFLDQLALNNCEQTGKIIRLARDGKKDCPPQLNTIVYYIERKPILTPSIKPGGTIMTEERSSDQKDFNRRDFLKLGATTSLGVALAGTALTGCSGARQLSPAPAWPGASTRCLWPGRSATPHDLIRRLVVSVACAHGFRPSG